MNKKRVNGWIEPAATLLEKTGIVVVDKKNQVKTIDSAFRGQISSFGAAVAMGSLKAAVAFFAQQGNAKVPRDKLMIVLYCLVNNETNLNKIRAKMVFDYVCEHDTSEYREKFLDAAVATKLAMNLYTRDKEGNNSGESESAV